jgi:hypothetical protein
MLFRAITASNSACYVVSTSLALQTLRILSQKIRATAKSGVFDTFLSLFGSEDANL